MKLNVLPGIMHHKVVENKKVYLVKDLNGGYWVEFEGRGNSHFDDYEEAKEFYEDIMD
jgi:hypothetical protein